jgi:hypothetical protein
MKKEERTFTIILVILILTPLWGTGINLVGGYLRNKNLPEPYPSRTNNVKEWHIGPDEMFAPKAYQVASDNIIKK